MAYAATISSDLSGHASVGEIAPLSETFGHYRQLVYRFVEQSVLSSLVWPDLTTVIDAYRDEMQGGEQPSYAELLPLLTCQAVGGSAELAVPVVAAWLFYNLASDLFDDLVDQDGKQRIWNEWAPGRAMSVGLGLVAAAQICLSHLETNLSAQGAIIRRYGQTMAIAARQQHHQARICSLEAYFQHILGKTGYVIATVAWSGARLQTEDEVLLKALHEYGLAVGVMVQLLDDLRDLQPGSRLSDLAANTYTLPIIYALSQTEHPRYTELTKLLADDLTNRAIIDAIGDIVNEMGAMVYTLSLVKVYEQKALNALCALPKEHTIHLVRYATNFLGQLR